MPVADGEAAANERSIPAGIPPRALQDWLETGLGLLVVLLFAGLSLQVWRFYEAQLRPYARTVKDAAPVTRAVRLDDRQAVRRWQTVLELLGEASTYLEAKRWDWARATLQRVLELDPGNPDALAMLHRMEIEPVPTLTPGESAARQREQRVVELLGAASSFLEAGQPDEARRLLQEAASLDPANPNVQAALSALDTARGTR
jgi:predicted Zn-dependent protease